MFAGADAGKPSGNGPAKPPARRSDAALTLPGCGGQEKVALTGARALTSIAALGGATEASFTVRQTPPVPATPPWPAAAPPAPLDPDVPPCALEPPRPEAPL